MKSALDSAIRKFEIINPKELKKYDPISFLDVCKKPILEKIRKEGKKEHGIKAKLSLVCIMKKLDHTGGKEEEKVEESFSNQQTIVLEGTNLEETYEKIKQNIVEEFEAYQKKGSGWIFVEILKLELYITQYNVTKASTYFPLPDYLKNKNAIINIKNRDNQCFKWCVTRALNLRERDNERIDSSLKKHAEKYNWSNVKFPSSYHDIDMFEKNNNIGIVVFGVVEKREIIVLRIPKEKYSKQIKLLLISNGKKKHYCVVKNPSRLLSSQFNNHQSKRYFCDSCLNSFQTQKSLDNHQEYCLTNDCVKTILPDGKKNQRYR